MSVLRALVVDDEPPSRRVLRQLARKHQDLDIVAEARDAAEALAALDREEIDLVFLDIQLPGQTGIDLVRRRGVNRMPSVVFVTAYDEFAVQAFELAAVDYLMKPVSQSRFDVTMQRVRRLQRDPAAGNGLHTLLEMYDANVPFVRRLRARVGTRDLVVPTAEILFIAAHGVYARLYSRSGTYLVRETMQWIEQRLDPATFVRIHRSFIVNAEGVRELRTEPSGDRIVVLKNGRVLPISRRRRTEAERMLLGK